MFFSTGNLGLDQAFDELLSKVSKTAICIAIKASARVQHYPVNTVELIIVILQLFFQKVVKGNICFLMRKLSHR